MNENTQNLSYIIGGNNYNITRIFGGETDVKEIIKRIISTKMNNHDTNENDFTKTENYDIINQE